MIARQLISEQALADLKARNPVDEVAQRWVTLRRKGNGFVGPCPFHSKDPQARDSTSFECWSDAWICAVCCDGGDVIKLVMMHEGIDFLAAVEWLGGAQQVDPEVEAA
jgi:DNA primase